MTYEVYTDCGNIGFRVGVIRETKEQARLSNTGISDEEKLEKVVVSVEARHQLTLPTQDLLELVWIVVVLQAGDIKVLRRHGGRC